MENSYILLKKLFCPKRIESVRSDILSVFSSYCETKNINSNIFELFSNDLQGFKSCALASQKLISLYSLGTDDKLLSELKNLCEISTPSFNTKPCLAFSSPRTSIDESYWKLPAHQDYHSNLGSKNGVTCWIPLVPMTSELGFLEVVEGSHHFGPLEKEDFHGVPVLKKQDWHFSSIEMEMGDVLVFHNLTIHRSGINSTDQIRLTAHLRYNDLAEKSYINSGYPKNRTND